MTVSCFFEGHRLGSIQIQVCQKGGACKTCGSPPSVPEGTWAWLDCAGGPIVGNEIKMTNPVEHLQFCEMEIYGTGWFFNVMLVGKLSSAISNWNKRTDFCNLLAIHE